MDRFKPKTLTATYLSLKTQVMRLCLTEIDHSEDAGFFFRVPFPFFPPSG